MRADGTVSRILTGLTPNSSATREASAAIKHRREKAAIVTSANASKAFKILPRTPGRLLPWRDKHHQRTREGFQKAASRALLSQCSALDWGTVVANRGLSTFEVHRCIVLHLATVRQMAFLRNRGYHGPSGTCRRLSPASVVGVADV